MKPPRTAGRNRRGPLSSRLLGAVLIVLAWAPVEAREEAAQPAGSEFQVNTYTTSYQYIPAVSPNDSGGFVVVWTSLGSSGGDTSDYSVQGQRFESSGVPAGAEFQVNTFTTDVQSQPAVAKDGAGGFVVSWLSGGSSATDSSSSSIQGQRFGSDGAPVDAEFQVNTYTTSSQYSPAAASLRGGGFVLVWMSDGSGGTDSSLSSIHGQLFGSDGLPLGAEFQANTYTTLRQRKAAVGPTSSGGFVVVWESDGSSGSDSSGYSILGQRFGADGVPDGLEFQVNTFTTLAQRRPTVGPNGSGFVVAWDSDGSGGTDSSGISIQSQRFSSDGLPIGGEFQVNSYTTSGQSSPAVAPDGEGGFVVVWTSGGSNGTDSDGSSVQARRFSLDGTPIGIEFQVNTGTALSQNRGALSSDGSGGFVIVWDSLSSSGTDSDGFSVQGQRFTREIFEDGFESGTTSVWSNTVPPI